MDLGLAGKVALVTGASRGIGLACATALAAEGARVAMVARTEEALRAAAGSIGATPIAADLNSEAGCREAVRLTESLLGPVDVLVNNLGGRAGTNWMDTHAEQFEE